jgi:hypothetical protein
MSHTTIPKSAYELAKIYALIRNAKLRAEVLMKETDISGKAKHFIRTSIINRASAMENDLIGLLPPADYQIMKEDLLQDETTLQIEGVTDMLLALPKEIRDQCEQYIEQMFYVYTSHKKAG